MKESTQKLYEERLLRVLVFIQRNLDRELSLEELARVAHFSPFHFHRIFRGMVGESFQEHIRRLRLERAAAWLKHTDRSVLEIALEARFQTHESFTHAFRAVLGCSPSQFRSDNNAAVNTHGVHYRDGDVNPHDITSLSHSGQTDLLGGESMEVKIERLSEGLCDLPTICRAGHHACIGTSYHSLWASLPVSLQFCSGYGARIQ